MEAPRAACGIAFREHRTLQYDAIGRLDGHSSDLGAFVLSYLGQTGQITLRQLQPAGSNLQTAWGYLGNTDDRRLASISNTGLSAGQFTNFAFTTTPENFLSAITETSDSATVYSASITQTASYNNLNQLTNLSSQALSYDANGNLLSDGQRNYSWDAENRLIAITYPGQPGKATAFTYDGLGRRTAITSTPAGGGSSVTTRYVWCGLQLCQARNSSNAPIRGYYAEGEFVPGSPGQAYYYGVDQLGSARRVFASASSAPAYSYDGWGNPLQATSPVTDFGFAGTFNNAESGLYLTLFRAYDPVAGRWLSRDPIGEMRSPGANLYTYVGGNPIFLLDPTGLAANCGGWFSGFGDYLYNSIDALARAPRDIAGMLDELLTHPLDALQKAGPGLAGLGMAIPTVGAGGVAARGGYTYTDTVLKNVPSRPYIKSTQLIDEIINTGKGVADPGGKAGALRYDVPGSLGKSKGTYELVVDPQGRKVYHFLFTSEK
jgi:RHS repeat-associated protein